MSTAAEPNPIAARADEVVIAKLRECATRARVLATEVYPTIPGAAPMVERSRLEQRRYHQLADSAPQIFAECDRIDATPDNEEVASDGQ